MAMMKANRIFYKPDRKVKNRNRKGKRHTGRPRHFTDEEFIKWYGDAEDMANLKQLSGVSLVSVYKHCKRLGLPSIGSTNITQSLQVYEGYRGRLSVAELASSLRITIPTIRNHLLRAVAYKWLRLGNEFVPPNPSEIQQRVLERHSVKPQLPRPKKIQHIKVVHELEADPALIEKPMKLHKLTNVAVFKINQYLTECKLKETEAHV